jgi:hypothetical protein
MSGSQPGEPPAGTVVSRVAARLDGFLTPERMRRYPAILLALGLLILVANTALGHPPRTLSGETLLPDYVAHWTGGRMLLTGRMHHLFDPSAQLALQRDTLGGSPLLSWYVSPPFVAVMYTPLALLPYTASAAVWTTVSVAMLVASLALLRPMLPRLGRQQWALVTLVVAATQPVLECVGSGQDSALSLLLWVAGGRLLASRRDAAGGAILALGLFKPQLFVIVPLVLLLGRRFRALAGWTLIATGLTAASFALVGTTGMRTWLAIPFTPLYQDGVQVNQAWKMQGVPALFTSLAPLDMARTAEAVGIAVALVIMVVTLVSLWRHPERPTAELLAFAALATVLASPHLVIYDLLIAVPALLYALDRHNVRITRLSLLFLFITTWTTALRHVVAEHLPWPLAAVVGAAWSVIPLSLVWFQSLRPLPAAPTPPDDPV